MLGINLQEFFCLSFAKRNWILLASFVNGVNILKMNTTISQGLSQRITLNGWESGTSVSNEPCAFSFIHIHIRLQQFVDDFLDHMYQI